MKVFKYGLLPPISNIDFVNDQMKKAHQYQNKLIEIERWRREEIRKIENQAGNIPELIKIQQEKESVVDALNAQIKKENANARKKVNNSDLKKQLLAAKKERKDARTAIKEARKIIRLDENIKNAKNEIELKIKEKEKEARKSDIAPWYGTYLYVEAAIDKTKKMHFYDGVNPNDPKYRRYDGSGRFGHFQLGSKDKTILNGEKNPKREQISKVVSTDPTSTTIQIIPMPAPSLKKNGSTTKKVGNKNLKLLRVRAGSDDKGKPIWAEFPMVYHRSLEGAIVQWQVLKRKVGNRYIWTISITCDINKEETNYNDKIVAIDLGWRQYDDRVVIATYYDSNKEEGEIAIYSNSDISKYGLLSRLKYVDDLKSIRDKEFDKIKNNLIDWLSNNKNIIPEWLAKDTETIAQWKSKNTLNRLIKKWNENRFNDDKIIMGKTGYWCKQTKQVMPGEGLLGWKYHDFHLLELTANSSAKARGALIEFYRIEASKLASKYGTIVFENINGNNLAKGKAGGRNRQLTSPFKFRNICNMIYTGRNLSYKKVNASYTSMICNECGHRNEKTSALQYFCENECCKVEIHRDRNAAKNIYEKYIKTSAHAPQIVREVLASEFMSNFSELSEEEVGTDIAKEAV